VDTDSAARHAHPRWLVDALTAAWGERAEVMLAANDQHPPMTLRLDPVQLGSEDFLRSWRGLGREARGVEWNPEAVVLEHAAAVQILPGFESGAVSVQDCGAQLAAPLLDARAGMRVLDACAAPGGKTLHIAQRTRGLAELVAADDDPLRLQRVRENLERGGLNALLLGADLRGRPPSLTAGSFDRVLVDAPCSATGVIRRHPDIKLLRRRDDIAALAARQLQLLRAVWALLAPGGRLVYASCSALQAETVAVVEAFKATDARARETSAAVRIAAGTAGMDGFYYACLEKTEGQ
jgi:16S rRNA (cytosine967-C5)-methyltransferase